MSYSKWKMKISKETQDAIAYWLAVDFGIIFFLVILMVAMPFMWPVIILILILIILLIMPLFVFEIKE